MKANRLLATLLAVALAAAVAAPAGAAQGKGKRKSGPQLVAEDPEGDWGENTDPTLAPVGSFLGQDLVEASIGMNGKDTVDFILKVTSLPPTGGAPEVSRYVWALSLNGEYFELDGKWSNYSRGACDPTSGQCPPPRDPGMQPFLVRGDCTTDASTNITSCQELGLVQASFDTGESTITIPVPMEMIGAKPGDKVTAGASDFTSAAGGPIIAIPTAFYSFTNFPMDTMNMTGRFVIRSGKKK